MGPDPGQHRRGEGQQLQAKQPSVEQEQVQQQEALLQLAGARPAGGQSLEQRLVEAIRQAPGQRGHQLCTNQRNYCTTTAHQYPGPTSE